MQVWKTIIDSYPHESIEFWGMQMVSLVAFWVPCTIYIALHKIAPEFSQRHKIQPPQKQPTKNEIIHCIKIVIRNQCMAMALQVGMLWLGHASGKPTPHRIDTNIPQLSEWIKHLVLCTLMREAGFYYSHRMFHSRLLYARFHKQHHKFTAPVAFAAQYAHPLEHLIANILPVALPPTILHSHIWINWTFVSIMLIETSTVHSGYDFFHGAAKKHDLHHEKFMLNFGAIGLLDWIHGTNVLSNKQKTR